jgi:hypothetical protein
VCTRVDRLCDLFYKVTAIGVEKVSHYSRPLLSYQRYTSLLEILRILSNDVSQAYEVEVSFIGRLFMILSRNTLRFGDRCSDRRVDG